MTWRADLQNQHHDQASGLRRLFAKSETPLLAFTSSQQDAGRHLLHVSDRVQVLRQFAARMTSSGGSVAIIDEHPAPGSIARSYGAVGGRDLKQVLRGDCTLDKAIQMVAPHTGIIAASRLAGTEFSTADDISLAGNLAVLRHRHDCILIDCVHRSARVLSPLACCADQAIMIVPADEELTASYALIKRIHRERGALPISVVVIRALDSNAARTTFTRLHDVTRAHLGLVLEYGGAMLSGRESHQRRRTAPGRGRKGHVDGMAPHSGLADSMV